MNSLKIRLAARKLFEARPNPVGQHRTQDEARLYNRWFEMVCAIADALESATPSPAPTGTGVTDRPNDLFDRTEFFASCQGLSKADFVALRLT